MSEYTSAIDAALAVMRLHLEGLNARDPETVARSLHFPHYRLSGGKMTTWESPDGYFDDFNERAGQEWGHTEWGEINVLQASVDKVHLDVEVRRFRVDGSVLATFRSLWVIARLADRWAAQLRSSFG